MIETEKIELKNITQGEADHYVFLKNFSKGINTETYDSETFKTKVSQMAKIAVTNNNCFLICSKKAKCMCGYLEIETVKHKRLKIKKLNVFPMMHADSETIKESLLAATKYCFETLNCDYVLVDPKLANKKLQEACGFKALKFNEKQINGMAQHDYRNIITYKYVHNKLSGLQLFEK